MRKFLLGFIIAALLFSVIPVSAAIEEYILYKADYKLVINGVEYTDEELPILNYKGYTYAPVRSVFEAAGLKVEWTGGMAVVSSPEPEPKEEETPVTELEEQAEVTEQTSTEPTTTTTEETDKKGGTGTPKQTTKTEEEKEPEPEPQPEPEEEPEPEPPKTRKTTLVYDGSKCGCGVIGRLANSRTIHEGGQEYNVCDVYCINPKCPLYNKLIGQVRWKVYYE